MRPDPSTAGPAPGRDHIVVVGASKTGTTGVYSTIKDGLARAGLTYTALFEPTRAEQVDALFTFPPDEPALVKVLLHHVPTAVPDPMVFDRRVMTVRDPRDVLISTLLFRPLTRRALDRVDDAAIEQFITAIERKERNPSSLSVGQLFNLASRLDIGGRPYAAMVADHARQRELLERHDFHLVRYERFVAGDLADLGEYLGVDVGVDVAADTSVADPARRASSAYGHISRAKEAGQFRHWFRADDLERFTALFGDALAAFGYDADVTLPATPRLDPATGSRYLRARYRERRRALSAVSGARTAAEVGPATDTAALADHADNGDAWACLRLAQAHRTGAGAARDDAAALHWARRSARLGLPEGMRLAADLLADAPSPALRRERRVWLAAATGALAPPDPRVAELRAQLRAAAARPTARLARAVRDPRRAARVLGERARARRSTGG